jgi:hypothetical protein
VDRPSLDQFTVAAVIKQGPAGALRRVQQRPDGIIRPPERGVGGGDKSGPAETPGRNAFGYLRVQCRGIEPTQLRFGGSRSSGSRIEQRPEDARVGVARRVLLEAGERFSFPPALGEGQDEVAVEYRRAEWSVQERGIRQGDRFVESSSAS